MIVQKPSSTKCEWRDLSHFVKKYNSENSESFDRTRCLDVEDRSSKQPEVLCKNESGETLVIERKSLLEIKGSGAFCKVQISAYLIKAIFEISRFYTSLDRIYCRRYTSPMGQ